MKPASARKVLGTEPGTHCVLSDEKVPVSNLIRHMLGGPVPCPHYFLCHLGVVASPLWPQLPPAK